MRTHGILILALVLGACSSSQYGGFLTDYSKLVPDEEYPSDLLAGYDYIVWPLYFSIRTGCADDGFCNRDRTSKS